MVWVCPHKYIILWKSDIKRLLWTHATQRGKETHKPHISVLFDSNSLVTSLCVLVKTQCQRYHSVICQISQQQQKKKPSAVNKHIQWLKFAAWCHWPIFLSCDFAPKAQMTLWSLKFPARQLPWRVLIHDSCLQW